MILEMRGMCSCVLFGVCSAEGGGRWVRSVRGSSMDYADFFGDIMVVGFDSLTGR